MDAIYTPPNLAELLTSACSLHSPTEIADFAAGDGALLKAAALRWPAAKLFGSDIDESAVYRLQSSIPGCRAALHDFFDRESDGPLSGQKFDLVLLNPPFSCRGNQRHEAIIGSRTYKVSKALAFVAKALRYLKSGGEIIAIVPASVMTSERDADALRAIAVDGTIEQIGDVLKTAFKSHAVAVAVLRIVRTPSSLSPSEPKPHQAALQPFAVELVRGSLPVHECQRAAEGPRFIHTTDLREGQLLNDTAGFASGNGRRLKGPLVLMSRVGRPSRGKIVLVQSEEVVLSDCVIALRTAPPGHESNLASLMRESWPIVQAAYGGSCAPYTTLKRIQEMLYHLGISSSIQVNSSKISRHAAKDDILTYSLGEKNHSLT
ncbi:putative RNA methylase [Bosea sp. BE109]|nr:MULTISPECIES: methyltransferase [unclassified Bosea (in: a-proteobacteria)]MDR6897618.1 putative RNA methylase [Bosea sp. BE109]